MPWAESVTPAEDKLAKRAVRLYMETWSATAESVRRQLQQMGYTDKQIDKAFRLSHITE